MNFIVDCRMPRQMVSKLRRYGIVYKSAKLRTADESISAHPDIQIHFITDNTAVCAPEVYEHYINILPPHINLKCGSCEIARTYPSSCAYNIARVGKYIICNTRCAEKTILKHYADNNYEIVHVNQGYAKCNICVVSSNLIVTEDKGIFNTVSKNCDIAAVLIEPGNIRLDGYDYGFIGGASGLAKDDNMLFFCGNISAHKQRKTICDALKSENVKYTELSDCPLYDFGSIITFK